MRIDAHLHVNFKGWDADRLVEYLDINNFDKCWLHTWEEIDPPVPSLYRPLPIEDVMEAHHKYPERIVPWYAPDPRSSGALDKFIHFCRRGVVGYGELKTTIHWNNQSLDPVLEYLNSKSMPILFHMEAARYQFVQEGNSYFTKKLNNALNGSLNGLIRKIVEDIVDNTGIFKKSFQNRLFYFPGYLLNWMALEERLIKYPDVKFIGHGPFFWKNMGAHFSEWKVSQRGRVKECGIIWKILEKYDNFYCDISGTSGYTGISRDKEKTEAFLKKFSHKILYGTDNFMFNQEELIDEIPLSDDQRKRIMGLNAKNILEEVTTHSNSH